MRTPALAGLALAALVPLAAAQRPAVGTAAGDAVDHGAGLAAEPTHPGGRGAPRPVQARGPDLARELGCGACHTGVGSAAVIRERAPTLGPAGDPLDAGFVFAYLGDPVRRRDDIGASRMPGFGLDEAERLALALHLAASGTDQGDVGAARRRHPDVTADTGARIWDALACAQCHGSVGSGPEPLDAVPGRPGPDLSREGARVRPDWLRDYLAAPGRIRSPAHPSSPGTRMPDFRLTPDEVRALAGWLETLGRPRAGDPTPLTPHQADRTGRMLTDRMACLGCHEVDGAGGAIGPSLEAAAARLRPGFVAEMILDPSAAAPGAPMPHQPMPEREARRLARLVLDRSAEVWQARPYRSLADPGHPAWVARGLTGREAEGARGPAGAPLYARHCAACHGAGGAGDGWNAPNLPTPPTAHADGTAMGLRPDDTLFDGIHAGAWVLDGSPRMPPFGGFLDGEQIRALVAYIRTLCGCDQPLWAGDGR